MISLDGALLWEVTHRTSSLIMQVHLKHLEEITFNEYNSPDQPVILNYPWLVLRNLQLDRTAGERTLNCKTCKSCFSQTDTPTNMIGPVLLEEESSDLSAVPTCYHAFKEVFSMGLTDHMTVASIFFLVPYHPRGNFIHFLDSKLRQ